MKTNKLYIFLSQQLQKINCYFAIYILIQHTIFFCVKLKQFLSVNKHDDDFYPCILSKIPLKQCMLHGCQYDLRSEAYSLLIQGVKTLSIVQEVVLLIVKSNNRPNTLCVQPPLQFAHINVPKKGFQVLRLQKSRTIPYQTGTLGCNPDTWRSG